MGRRKKTKKGTAASSAEACGSGAEDATRISSKSEHPLYSIAPDGQLPNICKDLRASDRWMELGQNAAQAQRSHSQADAVTQQCYEKTEAISMLRTVGLAFYHTILEKRQVGIESRIPDLTSKQKAVLTGYKEVCLSSLITHAPSNCQYFQCRSCCEKILAHKWHGHVNDCMQCDESGKKQNIYYDSSFADCADKFYFFMRLDDNDVWALVDSHYRPTPPSTEVWADKSLLRKQHLKPFVDLFLKDLCSPENGTMQEWKEDFMQMIEVEHASRIKGNPFKLKNTKMPK